MSQVPVLLTVGEIAKRLDVSLHRVEYILRSRRIQPAGRAGNARVFSEEDLTAIKVALADAPTRHLADDTAS